ncbi:MAG TPA: hypothetical protein VMC80_00195 [Patescibacteria group bacterium]|nr:hypothetical protein [Patescibacteria group bacterium]
MSTDALGDGCTRYNPEEDLSNTGGRLANVLYKRFGLNSHDIDKFRFLSRIKSYSDGYTPIEEADEEFSLMQEEQTYQNILSAVAEEKRLVKH